MAIVDVRRLFVAAIHRSPLLLIELQAINEHKIVDKQLQLVDNQVYSLAAYFGIESRCIKRRLKRVRNSRGV